MDAETIPEAEYRSEKKVRKKKVMTDEMLQQLALARQKALEVKKTLKGDEEAKIQHAKERMKKEKSKPKKKEEILEIAKKQLQEEAVEFDSLFREKESKEIKEEPQPEPEPEPEYEPIPKKSKEVKQQPPEKFRFLSKRDITSPPREYYRSQEPPQLMRQPNINSYAKFGRK